MCKNVILLAAAALVCAGAPVANAAEPVGLLVSHGFCIDGVWSNTAWPGGLRPRSVTVWGSYCAKGDQDTGRVETQAFLAPPVLNMYLAGYVGMPGRRLLLKNIESGEESEFKPATPGDQWRFYTLPVPHEWVGKPVQLVGDDQEKGIQGWLGFTLPFLPPSALTLPVIDTSAPVGDLCSDGVFGGTKWPLGAKPAGVTTWGTFCKKFDADTGWIASQPVIAGSYLSIYVAGYPGNPGLRLVAENLEAGRQLPLLIEEPPAEMWRLFHFRLPPEWRGQTIRIVAEDTATGQKGWLAFSDPAAESVKAETWLALRIVGLTVVLGMIVLLPSIAACLLAAVRGIDDELDLMTIGFLALGMSGYLAFWIYFLNRMLGIAYSAGGILLCCAAIGYCLVDRTRRSRLRPVRQLLAPVVVVMLATVCVMSLGLVHGGEDTPLLLAPERFAPPVLAGDNELPKWFADGIWVGHVPSPIMADWLASDRPPLQTGNALWIYPWAPGNREPSYQAISVLLQCSFLAGLWSFLRACKIDRRLLTLAIASCFFSGFTLLNEFFVWPKLYPVGFLLLVCGYVLTDRFPDYTEPDDQGRGARRLRGVRVVVPREQHVRGVRAGRLSGGAAALAELEVPGEPGSDDVRGLPAVDAVPEVRRSARGSSAEVAYRGRASPPGGRQFRQAADPELRQADASGALRFKGRQLYAVVERRRAAGGAGGTPGRQHPEARERAGHDGAGHPAHHVPALVRVGGPGDCGPVGVAVGVEAAAHGRSGSRHRGCGY